MEHATVTYAAPDGTTYRADALSAETAYDVLMTQKTNGLTYAEAYGIVATARRDWVPDATWLGLAIAWTQIGLSPAALSQRCQDVLGGAVI